MAGIGVSWSVKSRQVGTGVTRHVWDTLGWSRYRRRVGASQLLARHGKDKHGRHVRAQQGQYRHDLTWPVKTRQER